MGHYTGHAFRLIFKADTPQGVLEMLRQVACIDPPEGTEVPATVATGTELVESHDAVKEMLADISYLMCCCSSYIKGWEDLRRLTQLEDGRWLLYTKASSKRSEHESVANFFLSLMPYLDVQEGDILMRSIYESGTCEDIYYIADGKIKYGEGMGYWYYGDTYDDAEHPGGDGVDVDWDPPWNLPRLQTLIALKKAWCQRPEGKRGPWNSSVHMTDDELNAYRRVGSQILVEKANGELMPFDPEKAKHWGQWASQDPDTPINLCPVVPNQLYADIPGLWIPHRTDVRISLNADHDGDTPSFMGMGRYYSESIDDAPTRDGLGRLKEFQYAQYVSTARYHEAIKHNDRAVYGESSTRMRPSRRKLLAKLAKYKLRAK